MYRRYGESLTVVIRPATMADVIDLTARMRQQDRAEARAAFGRDAKYALRASYLSSAYRRVGVVFGRVICMWGVGATEQDDVGQIWCAGSPELTLYKLRFAREAQRELEAMLTQYRRLQNWVWEWNKDAVKFLKWLGFTVERPSPRGRRGEHFRYFFKERQKCVSLRIAPATGYGMQPS